VTEGQYFTRAKITQANMVTDKKSSEFMCGK